MKELRGDMFDYKMINSFEAMCITTNGMIKKNGLAVMGAGVAKIASDKYPELSKHLAECIKLNGHKVQIIEWVNSLAIISFPTKYNFWDKSDINLIEKSSWQLKELTDHHGWKRVVVPRPGCHNGGLKWENVKITIEKILDDRFYLINR